ncbi:peptidylprolyl isomerase [Ketogulonicigenium vulgare]|uniref:Peptidyl-prolyl cis-trans isomerase D, putative n=1 Tax=Ketogulonicigenium vulgare (strain WSH-001) TaxID=759362 RepID=F9Y3T9_KETVW|nr:peptidylprolyl isomerase [Ketogulonicigenium vulgare]ADO42254.1 peptidyl-prolyl cis-trans isomerase D, putative [Ketogulonicigenium vulgare Y25]AEM40453.1 peptidyl-prolyl cis-trans isomerase D, putative [Ketogulonicigenium vulgare WSH-001]ALJ80638.1 peptidylprolyl isomerase [Ketogulonicigenium vulgare]ANW33455.1 peptidylprolyl isomerase [Ketogulonicigenium vulgare]AOZ54169.1 peptidyl-prolyl cis-trans isomerase D [Ketogulonicigenium vulgare]
MATKKRTSPFVWAGFILIAGGLMITGGLGLSGTVRNVGKVGDKTVTALEYQGAMQQGLQQMRQMFGNTLTFAQFQQMGGEAMAREQLVQERALENEASRIGLSVGDLYVARQIQQISAFQGLTGGFSLETYRAALRQVGLAERQFEDAQRDAIASGLLSSAIAGDLTMPAIYAETLARFRGERRVITWAAVTAANVTTDIPAPTEEDLQAYHDSHPDVFTTPETRRVTYAALTPEMAAETIEVSEDEIRALYDQRIDSYIVPERRIVDRLTFNNDADATAALARIQSGEITFTDLANEMGFSLEEIDQGEMTEAALGEGGAAVFAAATGDTVGPVPSRFGPVLYRVNVDLAAEETPYDAVRDTLRNELAASRAGRVIAQEKASLTDLVAGGAQIEDIVNLSDLRSGTLDWQEGNTEGMAAYEPFRAAIAAAEIGAFPAIVDLPDGGIFVLRLDEIVPPRVQTLDEMRAYAEVMWRFQATQDAVATEAARLAEAVEGGATFEELGLTATTEPALTRSDVVAGTPYGTMTTAFTLDSGDVTTLSDQGTVVILRLDSIATADESNATYTADRDALAQTLNNSLAGDVMQAYGGAVRATTSVSFNETAVSSINTGL